MWPCSAVCIVIIIGVCHEYFCKIFQPFPNFLGHISFSSIVCKSSRLPMFSIPQVKNCSFLNLTLTYFVSVSNIEICDLDCVNCDKLAAPLHIFIQLLTAITRVFLTCLISDSNCFC